MELTHSFTVPVGADRAFEVLTDIERIAPCMPGASIDSVDGDEFTGKVKVKVGPMQVTYRGKAEYAEVDHDNHSAVIEARAQEMRGSGTANATISAQLKELGPDETEVSVVSSLAITGRPAQFGRGVMNEVGGKLLGQFADCLAGRLTGDDEEPEEEAETPAAAGTATSEAPPDDAPTADAPTADAPTGDAPTAGGAVGSNGSSAASSEQEIAQQVGAASPQPATGAAPAAAAAAPSSAAATSGADPAGPGPTSARTTRPSHSPQAEPEPIDLFDVAGPSILKRVVPAAAVLLALLVVWRLIRR